MQLVVLKISLENQMFHHNFYIGSLSGDNCIVSIAFNLLLLGKLLWMQLRVDHDCMV